MNEYTRERGGAAGFMAASGRGELMIKQMLELSLARSQSLSLSNETGALSLD